MADCELKSLFVIRAFFVVSCWNMKVSQITKLLCATCCFPYKIVLRHFNSSAVSFVPSVCDGCTWSEYLWRSIYSQDLLGMVHKYDPNVGKYYRTQTERHRKSYLDSFRQIDYILSDPDRVRSSEGAKVSQRNSH